MNSPTRRSAIQCAEQTVYASIEWDASDVRMLRPGWEAAKAIAFLGAVEERLADATLAAGWAALSALLAEYERSEKKNGDQDER